MWEESRKRTEKKRTSFDEERVMEEGKKGKGKRGGKSRIRVCEGNEMGKRVWGKPKKKNICYKGANESRV